MPFHPAEQAIEESFLIQSGIVRPAFLGNCRADRVLGSHVRRQADAFDLPFEQERRLLLIHRRVRRELDAR